MKWIRVEDQEPPKDGTPFLGYDPSKNDKKSTHYFMCHMTQDEDSNIFNNNAFVYRPKNYSGPQTINCIPSKECDEYHKNAVVQINLAINTEDC